MTDQVSDETLAQLIAIYEAQTTPMFYPDVLLCLEELATRRSAVRCPNCPKPMTLHCEPCAEETRKWDEWDAADAAAMSDSK